MLHAAISAVPTGWRIALAVPLVLAAAFCCLAQPEFVSIVAPFTGPWAGWLYGHQECTLGAAMPGLSLTLLAGGVLGLLAWFAFAPLRAGAHGTVCRTTAVIWTFVWAVCAAMSVANTTI